ncbi:hypothetical protein [Flexibacterium corallicola]|uniref:hypothetical protein n=1 Tax=Flexibacterium corallicola TaxID=3037259 RepID=UPI00286F8339|nr:hypothetical protein [Pseudovibrio sp. M1P-2-3]
MSANAQQTSDINASLNSKYVAVGSELTSMLLEYLEYNAHRIKETSYYAGQETLYGISGINQGLNGTTSFEIGKVEMVNPVNGDTHFFFDKLSITGFKRAAPNGTRTSFDKFVVNDLKIRDASTGLPGLMYSSIHIKNFRHTTAEDHTFSIANLELIAPKWSRAYPIPLQATLKLSFAATSGYLQKLSSIPLDQFAQGHQVDARVAMEVSPVPKELTMNITMATNNYGLLSMYMKLDNLNNQILSGLDAIIRPPDIITEEDAKRYISKVKTGLSNMRLQLIVANGKISSVLEAVWKAYQGDGILPFTGNSHSINIVGKPQKNRELYHFFPQLKSDREKNESSQNLQFLKTKTNESD